MKKLLLTLIITLLAFNLFASTREEAEALYAKRAEDATNSLKAAEIYADLAAGTDELMIKADYLYRESEARYYYGTNKDGYWPVELDDIAEVPDALKDERMAIHKKAYQVVEEAIVELKNTPESSQRNEILGKLIFFYGANLGKWGENNGPVASLGQWGTLKDAMKQLKTLGVIETEAYGSYRILGRGYYKLASLPGFGYKKAVSYLKKAYENSLNEDGTTSVHGLNTLFLAEALIKTKKQDAAKRLLEAFIKVDPETLHLGRIPETKVEQEFARKILETL